MITWTRNGADYELTVPERTEDEQRKLLIDASVDLLAKSNDALEALANEVNVGSLGEPQKWAQAVVNKLVENNSPPRILNSLVRAQRKLDQQQRTEAADIVERVAYYVVPAALTDAHVKQMQIIADSKAHRFQFQAKTKTFVEIAIARINGRGTKFRPVTAHTDLPSGQLCLRDPPEEGMDEGHTKFISNFVTELGEMIGSDLREEDESETLKAINAELEAQLDLEGWQYYYVFENPHDEADRRRRHELAATLDQMFPSIAFIGLDRLEGSQEELDTIPRMMRILCRAAGIEYKPHGTT
jgi:hypothetical protein